MPEKPRQGGGYSHFRAFNALVDGGWISLLNRREVAVFLTYLRRADKDGLAYPGITQIAAAVGQQVNHVCTARKRLVELGLLAHVGDAVYKITASPDSPATGLIQSTGGTIDSPPAGLSQSKGGTITSPRAGRKVVQGRDSLTSYRTTQLTASLSEGGEGGDARGKPKNGEHRPDVAAALKLIRTGRKS